MYAFCRLQILKKNLSDPCKFIVYLTLPTLPVFQQINFDLAIFIGQPVTISGKLFWVSESKILKVSLAAISQALYGATKLI